MFTMLYMYTLFTMFTMLYTLFAFRSVFSVCVYVCVGSGGVYVYMSACIAVFVCMCVCNDDVCVIWLYESLRGRHATSASFNAHLKNTSSPFPVGSEGGNTMLSSGMLP